MKTAAWFVLSASSVASAQQYMISTFAGGAPPPTPIAAVNASIGIYKYTQGAAATILATLIPSNCGKFLST
jgi:hypothetical protein